MTSTWQFCDRDHFWDGENLTLSMAKSNRDLQIGDKKVTAAESLTWKSEFSFSSCFFFQIPSLPNTL